MKTHFIENTRLERDWIEWLAQSAIRSPVNGVCVSGAHYIGSSCVDRTVNEESRLVKNLNFAMVQDVAFVVYT